MSRVRSHADLLEVLEHTPYCRIIERYPPDEDGNYDLSAIEDALENESLSQLKADIGKIKSKKERAQLIELFTALIDYNNYSRIMRLKRYYRMNNSAVRKHLLNYGSFTGRTIPGQGVTAEALTAAGIKVYDESALDALCEALKGTENDSIQQ